MSLKRNWIWCCCAPRRPTNPSIKPISLPTNHPLAIRFASRAKTKSWVRCSPIQIVFGPGGPSELRFKNPPQSHRSLCQSGVHSDRYPPISRAHLSPANLGGSSGHFLVTQLFVSDSVRTGRPTRHSMPFFCRAPRSSLGLASSNPPACQPPTPPQDPKSSASCNFEAPRCA